MLKVALGFEKNFLNFLVKICKIVKVLSLWENDFHFYKELYKKNLFLQKEVKMGNVALGFERKFF